MSTVINLDGITLPGSGYPHISDFTGPQLAVTRGLVGLYVLGGSLEMSRYNWADPDTPLTAVGSPSILERGAVLNNGNHFDTSITLTSNRTFMAISKPSLVTSNGGFLVSNFDNGGRGDTLGFPGNATPRISNFHEVTISGTPSAYGIFENLTGADDADWNFFAGRANSASQAKVGWGHDGALTLGAQATGQTRTVYVDKTLLVGGHYGSGFGGYVSPWVVAIFNESLTDQEISDNYEALREYAQIRGIGTV